MDLHSYMQDLGRAARAASRELARADTRTKNAALLAMADAIERDAAKLLAANADDVKASVAAGLAPAMVDRLTLTAKTVAGMAEGLRQIASLPDPVGELLSETARSNGLVIRKTAVPLGVAAGVYLEEYAPKNWITELIEINVTNLAGVPSIIYGLLALGLFVYTFGLGQSILTAGLTLALLILPVVIVATREAIRSIPQIIREGAYACGATTWQVVSHHIVPYSSAGILTGVIIGMARAIGETAPIITVGALTFIAFLPPAPFAGDPPAGLFDWLFAPFTVMPIQMFNWTSRPDPAFLDNAAAAGFILVLMTVDRKSVV